MRTTSILATAAIALVAGLGSASAADQFTTIAGFEAQAMTMQELDSVRAGAGNVAHGSPNVGPTVTPWSALFDNAELAAVTKTAGKSGVMVLVPRRP